MEIKPSIRPTLDQPASGSGLARVIEALERAGCEPNPARGTARCPAHDDRNPSLGFKQGSRGALVVCRTGGCSTEAITTALGLQVAALFDDWTPAGFRLRSVLRLASPVTEPEPTPEPLVEIPEFELWRPGENVVYVDSKGVTRDCVAADIHVYRRADGRAHHVVVRVEPPNARKWFLPLRWDGRVWRAGAQPRPATIYRRELLAVPGLRQIVVAEGEKSADAINRRDLAGLLAVTWPGGASAADRADWSVLAGRDVLLWPDADDAGREAMKKLAAVLVLKVASLGCVLTDDLPKGFDAADVPSDQPMLDFLAGRVVAVSR